MADLLDIAGVRILRIDVGIAVVHDEELRSEEHTSELQCQISYAVFCLKKKKKKDIRDTRGREGHGVGQDPATSSNRTGPVHQPRAPYPSAPPAQCYTHARHGGFRVIGTWD